jgi:S1-C subfamily serine protease
MQLTKNHLNDLIEDETISARLKFSLFEYNQTDSESVVFISSILPGSTVNSIELIEPGDIVLNINGETIKTIADVKKGLSNPIDGNILIYCNKNKLFIHPIEKLLEIDKSLKERYNF